MYKLSERIIDIQTHAFYSCGQGVNIIIVDCDESYLGEIEEIERSWSCRNFDVENSWHNKAELLLSYRNHNCDVAVFTLPPTITATVISPKGRSVRLTAKCRFTWLSKCSPLVKVYLQSNQYGGMSLDEFLETTKCLRLADNLALDTHTTFGVETQ